MKRKAFHLFGILLLLLIAFGPARPAAAGNVPQGNDFIKQTGPDLRLNGKIFRFAGTNNYYLMYKSQYMVDDVLETAAAQGFRVIRMWGSLEIGNQDGSDSIQGKADGAYFQYWDGDSPAYNDGPDGLERLDYVLYKAGQLGIKVVIPFVNNWNAFGGMDQYVRWYGGQYHDQFYTEPVIRQWYKNWIAHLLNRTNTYTGIQYKNDPTIMTWELANEPRCLSAGAYPRSPSSCSTETLTEWADDVSTFIKTIDSKHLVSAGDEGFYCIPGATDWTENCGEGVDTLALTALENIDIMSFHLYPDHWGKTAAWGTEWIKRHFAEARALDKPAMLGEYGWLGKATRNPVFKEWTDAVFKSGGTGALYWILSGREDNGTYYADYDGFTVYCPSPVCTTISNFGKMMKANKAMYFPPVADNDAAITEFETPVPLPVLANDIAYQGATIVPTTVDLDPAVAGQQTAYTVTGGTFTGQTDGTVLFTPAVGFNGKAQAFYTVQDSKGSISNPAEINITVKPSPTAPVTILSFETGTEGWGPAPWLPPSYGTAAQTTNFHTDGAYGLQVDVASIDWFGVTFAAPINLSGRTKLKFDIQTFASGTNSEIAMQIGDNWTWCEAGGWGWIGGNTTKTVEIDLTTLGCSNPDLSQVHSLLLYMQTGTFYLDYFRAE